MGRKWKRPDSSRSDSVEFITSIFDFHMLVSALTTATPPPTRSLVKTSLWLSSHTHTPGKERLTHFVITHFMIYTLGLLRNWSLLSILIAFN